MEQIRLLDSEKMMFSWWLKIRWFIVLILFAIGLLRIGLIHQTVPIIALVGAFIGISVLNILFHLQIITSNNIIGAAQIILDIIFGTIVVHLTGGLSSSFVWIFLIAVVTASLSIEKAGGFIAAMIGSLSLLFLILMYNFGWLVPIDGHTYNADVATQTIFLISYTGLFTVIAFISSFISDMVRKLSLKILEANDKLKNQEDFLRDKEDKIVSDEQRLKEYEEVVKVSAGIAGIDHDINNPLSIISLSLSRVKKAASEYNDEKLHKSSNQITEAINKINGILSRLQELKRLPLIKESRGK
ncbi:MAG TPA: histidine kinase [Candidatus Cloacimonetes bacterium]|nr:histidine kinase [Candidatus Cloacimonadota bacterium]HEX38387.1 histidine kinase [Candidatus Cloacimonadota bacterium]